MSIDYVSRRWICTLQKFRERTHRAIKMELDCFGGLDERNLLTCGKNDYEQRSFDFHCSNEQCIPYLRLCKDRCSNECYFARIGRL